MYAIQTTPGFIIDSRPYGEAGKLISIFTRDFGLVTANASGIRFERSKLRYHAQDYSLGSFSLVRGKELWRLTSAAPEGENSVPDRAAILPKGRAVSDGTLLSPKGREANSAGDEKVAVPEAQALIARVALLLRRLLHGEEANPGLFECVESAMRFIHGDEPEALNEERLKTLESLTVIRIMHRLGYVGDVIDLNGHVVSSGLSIALLDDMKEKRHSMNSHINKALKESHL